MKDYFFTIRIKINALRVVIFIMLMLGIMGVAYVAKVQYKRIAKYNEIVRGNENRLQMLPKQLDVSTFRFEKPKSVALQNVSFDLPSDLAYTIKEGKGTMGVGYSAIEATSLTLWLNTPLPVKEGKGVRYAFGAYEERLEPFLTTPARPASLLFMNKHLYSRYISNLRHKVETGYDALYTFDSPKACGILLDLHDGRGVMIYAWFKDIELGQRIIFDSKSRIDMQFVGSFLNSLAYCKLTADSQAKNRR